MTNEFYAVVKTAIKNTNWDSSQMEIVNKVIEELEVLHKAEVKPEPIKIEGLETTAPKKDKEVPMPEAISDTIASQVEALKMNEGIKIKDPADLVIEEPLGFVDSDEVAAKGYDEEITQNLNL